MDKFTIDPKSPVPVWAQTKARIIYLILSGHYQPGDKLPTVRDLAEELHINYNTVNKAYQDLERDGYTTVIRGKGAYITEREEGDFSILENDIDFLIQELISKSSEVGMTGEELTNRLITRLKKEGRISPEAIQASKTIAKGA